MMHRRTHRADRRRRRARGGLVWRRLLAVSLALAVAGATVANATPGRPRASALVKHERVGKPGTYRITIELWSNSASSDSVVLRVADRTRHVTLDRHHRRMRVTLRVKVAGRSFTIRATGTRRSSAIRLAVQRLSGPSATTPAAPTTPKAGSTGASGASGSAGLVGGAPSSGPTGTGGSTGSSGPSGPSGSSAGEQPSGEAMPVGDIPGWTQTYAQDFSGTTLPPGWDAYTGMPGGDPAGWFDASHVSVSNGELQILSSIDPAHCPSGCTALDDYVTGGVQLYGHAQTYGKYEIRMRADNAKGLGLTVLLWPTGAWPPEIDIVGDVGISPRIGTAVGDIFGDNNTSIDVKNKTVDLTQWHTWGAEWTPGQVAFTVDGTVWATADNPNISSAPMNLAIQIQAYPCSGPGSFGVCVDSTTPASSYFDVDWVTQYSPS